MCLRLRMASPEDLLFLASPWASASNVRSLGRSQRSGESSPFSNSVAFIIVMNVSHRRALRSDRLLAKHRQSPTVVRTLRRYYTAVRLPVAIRAGLIAHRFPYRPAAFLRWGDDWVSRFSRVELLHMRGVFDSAGPRRTCDIAHRCAAQEFHKVLKYA
jgi:hypothetical protein